MLERRTWWKRLQQMLSTCEHLTSCMDSLFFFNSDFSGFLRSLWSEPLFFWRLLRNGVAESLPSFNSLKLQPAFLLNKQLQLVSLKSPPAVSVLINCTSSPIFRVISDCFFATQSTEHGQLLKVVSRSDKWLNPCTKAFFTEGLIATV